VKNKVQKTLESKSFRLTLYITLWQKLTQIVVIFSRHHSIFLQAMNCCIWSNTLKIILCKIQKSMFFVFTGHMTRHSKVGDYFN